MIETSVIIVGGGPAGSACALRLKEHNIDCVILDQARFPRFKPCAGWMSPEAVGYINLDQAGYPYSFTTLRTSRISIRGFKFTSRSLQYAIRRVEFDDWLLRRSDAPFYVHTVKSILHEDDRYIVDGEFSARYIVGAGGTYCPVFRTFFKPTTPKSRDALIVAQEDEFAYPYADADCWLWYLENRLPGYAWYVPKANGYVNVGVGGFAEQLNATGDSLKRHWNLLVDELDRLGLVRGHEYSPSSHSYYLRRDRTQIQSGNAFLIGDAAGLATSDMGEGIGAGIRSGQLAADAIASGDEYRVESIPRYSLWPPIGKALVRFGFQAVRLFKR
jgi:flavin-dependent dehydrogenase